jgi:hypothetical protein
MHCIELIVLGAERLWIGGQQEDCSSQSEPDQGAGEGFFCHVAGRFKGAGEAARAKSGTREIVHWRSLLLERMLARVRWFGCAELVIAVAAMKLECGTP